MRAYERRYETASGLDLESRAAVIERMKRGKELHEKRQALTKQIDRVLKKYK